MRTLTLAVALAMSLALATPAQAKSAAEGTWVVQVARKGWKPDPAQGTLVLRRVGKKWEGDITFRVLLNGRATALEDVLVKGRKISFRLALERFDVRMAGELKKGAMSGRMTWKSVGEWSWTAIRPRPVVRFEKGLKFGGHFPKGVAEELGLDGDAVDELIRAAEDSHTDALVVVKDGKIVVDRRFGRKAGPVHLMSVTKLVAAVGVAKLLEDGKIPALDTPLSKWFPEWKKGDRGKVTLKHVLTHTSGIAHGKTARELNRQTDKVAYVRKADLATEPGAVYSYNNDAVALLTGVIARAAGKPTHEYLDEILFRPLEIEDRVWDRDEAGNALTYAQLQLTARGLARIGQMIAGEGVVAGNEKTRVLRARTVRLFATPTTDLELTQGLVWRLRHDDGPVTLGSRDSVLGVYHTGWLGQFLEIRPRDGLVAVRLRRWSDRPDVEGSDLVFGRFPSLLDATLPR